MARLADLAVALAAATALFPLAVIFLASLMPPGVPQFPPASPSTEGYQEALKLGFGQSLLNSAVVALLTVAITVALSAPTGYALARLGFSRQTLLVSVALVALTRALPPSSLLVAIYDAFWRLNLLNNCWALQLPTKSTPCPSVSGWSQPSPSTTARRWSTPRRSTGPGP
jgi:ABC-type sugar transport system, permease component